MTQTLTMLAPVAGGQYVSQRGNTYTADANRLITAQLGDVESLSNFGCLPVIAAPVLTPVVSSYIAQGAINQIASSSSADAFTLAAPSVVGQTTTIVNKSTAVPTVTSSAADILTSTGGVCTVLTGTVKGTIELEAVGSTAYQVTHRSGGTSSAGAAFVYNWASS